MRALFVSLLLPLLLIATPPSFAERLTIERLHADPALSGASPRKVKISPDGTRVTFLRGRDDDQFQLDLWEFNLHDKAMRRLVDSKLLKPSEQISDQEKARRERERDRKSTRLNSSHTVISYAVFCLKK